MFRLSVDLVIARGRDSAVIAGGLILEGRVERGDLVVIQRTGEDLPSLARVRQIDRLGKPDLPAADATQKDKRISLILDGITPDNVLDGDVLVGSG